MNGLALTFYTCNGKDTRMMASGYTTVTPAATSDTWSGYKSLTLSSPVYQDQVQRSRRRVMKGTIDRSLGPPAPAFGRSFRTRPPGERPPFGGDCYWSFL